MLTLPEDLEKVYPRDKKSIEELRKMRILLQDELYKRRSPSKDDAKDKDEDPVSRFKVIDDVIIDKTSISQQNNKVSSNSRNDGFRIDEAIGHLKYMAKDAKNKDKAIVLAVACNLLPEQ